MTTQSKNYIAKENAERRVRGRRKGRESATENLSSLDDHFPVLAGLIPKWTVCCLDLCPEDFFFKAEKRKVDGRETGQFRSYGQSEVGNFFSGIVLEIYHGVLQPGRSRRLQTFWKWVWTPRPLLHLFFWLPTSLAFSPLLPLYLEQ